MSTKEAQLTLVVAQLALRREAIMQAWRRSVEADPSLTTGAALPSPQLQDHLPALLVDFEGRLTAGSGQAGDAITVLSADAAAHGLHRWQQGFDMAEVMRELSRFNECVVIELDVLEVDHAGLDPALMPLVRRMWAQQYGAAVSASTLQYFRLQQLEASSQIKDLAHALDALRELEQQRAHLWQQAAHDLRGNLGVVASATAVLTSVSDTQDGRQKFLHLLDRNVSALRHLLNDVTDLARLQSGQERRNVAKIDAAAMLSEMCESLQTDAQAKGLVLTCHGPPSLYVHGDAVKARRVAQNLVLNAIRYTRKGGVVVSWGDGGGGDSERWFLQVQDTGPGFDAGPGSPIAGALKEATQQAEQVSADASEGVISHADGRLSQAGPSEQADGPPPWQQPGEGIGLSIVKRLCELLNATLSVDSKLGAGTTFHILFPRHYSQDFEVRPVSQR